MNVEKLIEKMPRAYKFYFWDGSFMGITEDGIKWMMPDNMKEKPKRKPRKRRTFWEKLWDI